MACLIRSSSSRTWSLMPGSPSSLRSRPVYYGIVRSPKGLARSSGESEHPASGYHFEAATALSHEEARTG